MVARPSEAVSCGSPAGIHSARVGGSTQVDINSPARHGEHPARRPGQLVVVWVCQSKRVPAGMGNVATSTAPCRGAALAAGERRGARGLPAGVARVRLATQLVAVRPWPGAGPDLASVERELQPCKLSGSPEWAAHIQDEVLPQATAGVSSAPTCSSSGRGRARPPSGCGSGWHGWSRSSRRTRPPPAGCREVRRDQRGGGGGRRGRRSVIRTRPSTSVGLASPCSTTCPPARSQDQVLAEAFRVLRPAARSSASDSLPSDGLHRFHDGDTYNPVEPAGAADQAADHRLHRDHPAGRAQPDLHRTQGEPIMNTTGAAQCSTTPGCPGLRVLREAIP